TGAEEQLIAVGREYEQEVVAAMQDRRRALVARVAAVPARPRPVAPVRAALAVVAVVLLGGDQLGDGRAPAIGPDDHGRADLAARAALVDDNPGDPLAVAQQADRAAA